MRQSALFSRVGPRKAARFRVGDGPVLRASDRSRRDRGAPLRRVAAAVERHSPTACARVRGSGPRCAAVVAPGSTPLPPMHSLAPRRTQSRGGSALPRRWLGGLVRGFLVGLVRRRLLGRTGGGGLAEEP